MTVSRRRLMIALAGAESATLIDATEMDPVALRISPGCQTNAWNIVPSNLDSLLAVLDTIGKRGFSGFETGFRNLQTHAAPAGPPNSVFRSSIEGDVQSLKLPEVRLRQ